MQRNPAGDLEGSFIQHQQVDARRQQKLECLRRPHAEVRGDIDIGRLSCRTRRSAAMQISEHGAMTLQHLDGLGGPRRNVGHVRNSLIVGGIAVQCDTRDEATQTTRQGPLAPRAFELVGRIGRDARRSLYVLPMGTAFGLAECRDRHNTPPALANRYSEVRNVVCDSRAGVCDGSRFGPGKYRVDDQRGTAAAALPTTGILAAGADEVSAAIAALFGAHGQAYQALSAQAAALHAQFVQSLNSASGAYAAAETANVEQQLLNAINALTQALLGRPLIGNGADGTTPGQAGAPGGLLYGNGGNGQPTRGANTRWAQRRTSV